MLYVLLRRGDAARVASLLYLVPPATAVMAWIGFGETLAPPAIAGMVLAAAGVALVTGPGARDGERDAGQGTEAVPAHRGKEAETR